MLCLLATLLALTKRKNNFASMLVLLALSYLRFASNVLFIRPPPAPKLTFRSSYDDNLQLLSKDNIQIAADAPLVPRMKGTLKTWDAALNFGFLRTEIPGDV